MQCPTCIVNFCVLRARLFNFDVDIANMEYYIPIIYKGLKARNLPKFVLFCDIKLYVSPRNLFSLWG